MTETKVADVTVVIPAMNRAHLIARSLRSVRRQTLPARRVVVVDDASDDATAAAATAEGADVLTMTTRSGSGPARNAGIAAAETRWIAFLDSDDEWAPDHLERLVAACERWPDAVLLTTPATTTTGRWLGNPRTSDLRLSVRELLVPGDLVVTSATLVRRDVIDACGGFRSLRRAQDLDLWLRVLEQGPGLALTRATVTYHEHAEQASGDKDLMREHFATIMSSVDGRPWMTPRLRDGSWARVIWDDARAAQRARDWSAVRTSAGWFVRHPWAGPALSRVLLQRRRARIRASAQLLH